MLELRPLGSTLRVGVLAVVVLLLLYMSTSMVPAGHVGVKE